MSSSTSKDGSESTCPLSSITHAQAKRLLLGLGCQPFTDECEFIVSELNGADLAEVESTTDLVENGVTATSNLRLKSIFRALTNFKEHGVPLSSISDPPDAEATTKIPPPSASVARNELPPDRVQPPPPPPPVSVPEPQSDPVPAPETRRPKPTEAVPAAPTISQEAPTPQENNSWNVSDTNPLNDTATPAVYATTRTPEQVGSIINTLVKEYAAGLAANLLECAYSMTFPSRPSDAALELWIQAYEEREKISRIDGSGSVTQRNEHHKIANKYVEEALKVQFWLPIRHACLWNYMGHLASVIFRLEYEVLRESFRAMEKEGQKLSPRYLSIKRRLDTILDELSLSDGNGFRISICRPGVTKEACPAGCLHVNGHPMSYCCVEHVYPSPPGAISNDFKLEDHKDLWSLLQDVRHWDPCISFRSVMNWPAAPISSSNNASAQKKNDPGSYWRITSGGFRPKFFHARSNYCMRFSPLPKVFLDRNNALFGQSLQATSEDELLDINATFGELLTVRNRLIGHSGIVYNAEDVWWTFTSVVMASHVIAQQSTKWLDTHTTTKTSPTMMIPSLAACQRLQTNAKDTLQTLLNWDEVLRSGYNSRRLHAEHADVDYYRDFVVAVNKFKAGESFLVLILPPLPAEFIPSSLAAVPWDLVVDFADLGASTDPTRSTAWKVLTQASSRDGVIKEHHKVKVSFDSSRIYRRNIDDLCEYLGEKNPVDVPWWQITSATPTGLLSELFDDGGRIISSREHVEEVIDAMNTVISRIFDTRVLRNRSVQLVVPMYGVYEMPCLNTSSSPSRWFFRSMMSPSVSTAAAMAKAVNTKSRNFETPYFLQHMLRSFTNDPKVNVKCTVLYQLDSTLAPIDAKKDFLSSEMTGLRSKCVPQLLYLPIELMMLRYRVSFIGEEDDGGSYGDALCIYQHNGALVPFVRRRNMSTASSSSSTSSSSAAVAVPPQLDLRAESHDNIFKLHKCGIDLLHHRSPEYSLKEFESKSFFSMLLNDPHSGSGGGSGGSGGRGRSNPLLRSTSKQALALLKFYFSYPPVWALFCKDTMAEDRNLSNPPFVVPREVLLRSLSKKAELLKHGRTTTDNTLIVRHRRRCGGTTLVRHFAWSIAFKEWHSVVLVLDERWNAVGQRSFVEVMQILQHTLEPGSYLILIADRHILSEPLKRLCDELKKMNFHFLLIRLQQLPETITPGNNNAATSSGGAIGTATGGGSSGGGVSSLSTADAAAAATATSVSAAATANLSFQTYGKVDVLTIDPDTVENRKLVAQDMDAIVNCMFQMVKYFDPTVDVNAAWTQYKKHGNLANRFKKIFFLGLLRFVDMATESRIPRNNAGGLMTLNTTSVSERSVYNTVIGKWMEDVVRLLYSKIDYEEKYPTGGYTTAAAVRALMYIAIIQLCSDGSLKLEINSLRVVFNDPTTSQPLFTAWEAHQIENVIFSKAFVNAQRTLEDQAYTNFSPVFGSLLPFIELLQSQTAAATAAAAAAGAAAADAAGTAPQSTAVPAESLFSFAPSASSSEAKSMEGTTTTSGSEGSTAAGDGPADEAVTMADLEQFPLFRQFRAVKDQVHSTVYSLADPTSPLTQATKKTIATAVQPKKDAIHNMAQLLAELLALPARLSSSSSSSSTTTVGGEGGGDSGGDELDDVSDLLWGEFLDQRDGLVGFVSNDVAEMFLLQALRHEEARYRSRRTTASPPEIAQLSAPSTQIYVLAMSLLHTISLDRTTVETLKANSFVDIQHEEDHDASLAWCAQHLFIARQYVFEKDAGVAATAASASAAAAAAAVGQPPSAANRSSMKASSSSVPLDAATASTATSSRTAKYVPKYQRWSWLLVRLQTPQASSRGPATPWAMALGGGSAPAAATAAAAAADGLNTATTRRSAFESLEMKFLIASHVAYSRYWRLSSAIARLMQYQLWRLTDDIAQLRTRIEENVGDLAVPTPEEFDTWMTSMYHRGIQLYLASTARMILAVDEIYRLTGVVNSSDGDRKKFAGTMDQLGNCIKAFICLNRETIYTVFAQLQQPPLPLLSSTIGAVAGAGAGAGAGAAALMMRLKEPQRAMMLKKFYGCSACLLMALGNMARYFYGLSIRIVSQPLGFGDEVDGWLHVLEGLQAVQRASLQGPRPVPLDLQQQLSLPTLTYEVMTMFCGERDAQWIKGAGPILYTNGGSALGGVSSSGGGGSGLYSSSSGSYGGSGGYGSSGSSSSFAFDRLVGQTMYYSTHIYSTNEIHDMIHSKLADFNEANMRMLEEKNTDFSYFDQNLCREELFIVRLADVAAGTGQFTGWKQLFDTHVTELQFLPVDDPLVPYKERSIARYADCMWREQALKDGSGAGEGAVAATRVLMSSIISSKAYHRVMVQVNQSMTGQRMVEIVVRSILHCITTLSTKYPIRLMTQLVELLSFVSMDSIQRVLAHHHGDFARYLPFTVELLMPLMEAWECHAQQDVVLRRCDEATVAAAIRFRTLLSFVSLWNHATSSSSSCSSSSSSTGPGASAEVDALVKYFHDHNGHYDYVQKRWMVGTLATTYKPYVHNMERYVLVRPMALQSASEDLSAFGMPLCIRKRFSIIEECLQEQQLLQGTLTPLEERYSSVLVQGVVLYLHCNDTKNRYEGVVSMDGSDVTLPFYYDKAEYAVLEQHRCALVVGHPCTFYITFLPWRVEAYAVQSTKWVATAPQQAAQVLLQQQSSHGHSGGSSTKVPRLPTGIVFVGDKKMEEIARYEERRESSHRRSAAAAAVASAPAAPAAPAALAVPEVPPAAALAPVPALIPTAAATPFESSHGYHIPMDLLADDSSDEHKMPPQKDDDNGDGYGGGYGDVAANVADDRHFSVASSTARGVPSTAATTAATAQTTKTTPQPQPQPTSTGSLWSKKHLALRQDEASAALQQHSAQAAQASLPAGVSFVKVFALPRRGGGYSEDVSCHFLDGPRFASLLLYRSGPADDDNDDSDEDEDDSAAGPGTILRFTTIADLYGEENVSAVLAGEYFDAESYIEPPTALRTHVYGHLIFRKDATTQTTTFSVFSPYKRLPPPIPLSCGLLVVPNFVKDMGCCLPCSDETRRNEGVGGSGNSAWLRILAHDICTMAYALNSPATSFGEAQSAMVLRPEVVRENKTEVLIGPSGYHRRLFLLWNMHTMSLMAVREGLLVLIGQMDAQGKADWSRLSLGVVYFSETTNVENVQRELEETWRRTKRRLAGSDWDQWNELQGSVRHVTKVNFPSIAAPIPRPSGPSAAAAAAPSAVDTSASPAKGAATAAPSTVTKGSSGKAPAVAATALPGKNPTVPPSQPKPAVPGFPVRPAPAAAVTATSKWGSASATESAAIRTAGGPATSRAAIPPPAAVNSSASSSGGGDDNGEDGWNNVSTVKKTVARPTKAVKTLGTCTFGLQCQYGAPCTNGPHPDDVERVFACFSSREERLQYKFRPCTRKDAHSAVGCFFYHERDANETTKKFCTNCLKEGHFATDCRVGAPSAGRRK